MWILVWRSAPADRNLANEGWPTRAQTRLGACAPMNAGGLAAGRLPLPPAYHRFLPWKGPGLGPRLRTPLAASKVLLRKGLASSWSRSAGFT